MKQGLFALGILVCALSTSAASVESIVAAFYPEELVRSGVELEEIGGGSFLRYQAHASLTLQSVPHVLGVYTNGVWGGVRLLRLRQNGAELAGEAVLRLMSGKYPGVEFRDLDNDSQPEAIVSFSHPQNSEQTWIFSLASGGLDLISPTSDGTPDSPTELTLPWMIDLDGDGKLELVETKLEKVETDGDEQVFTPIFAIYRLVNGRFAAEAPVAFFTITTRERGEPDRYLKSFRSSEPGNGLLVVSNGGIAEKRTSAASVYLNGIAVVTPAQLNQTVGLLKIPVVLQAENALEVRMAGAPGSEIAITIYNQSSP